MNDAAQDVGYEAWVGREETHVSRIDEAVVAAMAATLDLAKVPAAGAPLPPGWQWLFFNPAVRRSELGRDGHPARGGFLPPVALPRRMWAGSRIHYLADLMVGAAALRTSKILKVEHKTGKRGSLCFVTVQHSIVQAGETCIVEEQDIVYRDPPSAGAPAPEPHDAQAEWSQPYRADTTLLFRYSALTFNGHRIHYDQAYAREEEGYPDLVVHGPLTATLLQQFAVGHAGGRGLRSFSFRGVAPLFVDRSFQLEARTGAQPGTLDAWARGPEGELVMSATARFR